MMSLSPTNLMRPSRPRADGGFGVVEVIIAVLIMLVVASTIGLAASSGNNLRGAARLSASLTEAGRNIHEDIATDRTWMKSCQTIGHACRDVESAISESSKQIKDVGGTLGYVRATATPLDSRVDGIGANDKDGLVPDYFQVRVVIRPAADVAARYRTTPARSERTFSTTIDGRGEQAFGSVAIELCRVMNQVDERMSIQGCAPQGASPITMNDCVPGQATCQSVFSWVATQSPSDSNPSPHVVLKRVSTAGAPISLSNGLGWSARAADGQRTADGLLVFSNVPAGDVMVNGIPATTSVGGVSIPRWKSKELPSFLGSSAEGGYPVMVEPGVRSRALAVFAPATAQGVDLHFKRRIGIRAITGGFPGHEIVVPKWTPTNSYVGDRAEFLCNLYQQELSYGDTSTCDGIVPGPGKNCVTVLLGFDKYIPDPTGTYTRSERGTAEIDFEFWDTQPGGFTGDRFRKERWDNTPTFRVCMEYWEEYRYTYYRADSGPTYEFPNGIAYPMTYAMTPMPSNRAVRKIGNATMALIPQCVAQRRQQCSAPSSGAPLSLRTLIPGLNTGVQASTGSYTGRYENPEGVAISNSTAAARNVAFGSSPPGAWSTLTSRATWVRPNGDIVGSTGGRVAAGTRVTLTGDGECYWTSPNFSGRIEGSCRRCNPVWGPGMQFVGYCSIVTKVKWWRHTRETQCSNDAMLADVLVRPPFNFPCTSRFNNPNFILPVQQGTIDGLFGCVSPFPTMIGGCQKIATGGVQGGGGDGDVPKTFHQGQGGTGSVNSHPATSPPMT